MSITVSDVLGLPSMRGAKVLGGARGLGRIVSSISVLEYTQASPMQLDLFENVEFVGNELVITGFLNNPDDEETQCQSMQRMSDVGEVGMILFYVGVVMKRVSPKLIALADELDFPLICMPRGRMDQRYGEVICEVMDLVCRDRMTSASLVSELLEAAARLPAHQRTVNAMLRLLADRLRASVALLDAARNPCNEAAWPRAMSDALREVYRGELPPPGSWQALPAQGAQLYRDEIQSPEGRAMEMLILNNGAPLDGLTTRQAVEAVQLAVRIWAERRERIVVGELVSAILQDEPLKMRRLADIFNVDIAAIDVMWILCGASREDAARLAELVDDVKADAQNYASTAIADIYDGALVLFMAGPASLQDARALTEAIRQGLRERGVRATITRCHALETTTRVREAFLCHRAHIDDARKIFRGRWDFTIQQLNFARDCRALVEKGERAVEEVMSCLGPLRAGSPSEGLLLTLECFLLDAEMSVARAAERMYLHKNTVKYRLQRIGDMLGFTPGEFPESAGILSACGLSRLLRREE